MLTESWISAAMLVITGTPSSDVPTPTISMSHSRPAQHCSLCLRKRPSVGKFHLFTVTNSSSIRAIMSGILGFEFDAKEFNVCTPCWSLVQTLDDFRTCCIQVNALRREINRGLKYEDEWFSEGNIRAIYNVRAAIQSHLERIEDYRYVDEEVDEVQVEDASDQNKTVEYEVAQAMYEEPAVVQDLNSNKPGQIETSLNSKEEHDDQTFNIIECEKCLNWFMTTAQIEYHLSRCQGPKKPIEEALYAHTCHLCQESFNRPYLLESHLNWHEDKKPYKCRIKCEEKFYGVELRYIHERSCPGDPRWASCAPKTLNKNVSRKKKTKPTLPNSKHNFECDICGKTFCKERVMKNHRREMHTPPKHHCKRCGKAFRRKFSYDVHLRVHARQDALPFLKPVGNIVKNV